MAECKHEDTFYRSIHSDSCCSCHISPPCLFCTDQELYCSGCETVIEHYTQPESTSYSGEVWKQPVFTPKPCGNGLLTNYRMCSASGSSMVYTGTYEGDVTNADLLAYFGSGSWGHRFGYCNNGRFQFTKLTD